MRQILFILVFSITLLGLLRFIFLLYHNDEKMSDENPFENMEILEAMAENSETNAEKSEDMNFELKKFYKDEDVVCQSGQKKYETLLKTVDNYVQRYISLFLITSNLHHHKIKDLNEEIKIDLEISITGQDLAFLQDYSKSLREFNYQKNLSKLDAIFSKIARLKERSYAEKAIRSSLSFFTSLIFSLFSNPSFYRFLSFLSILIVIWISRYYLFNKSFYIFLVVFINSTIIWEGLNLYSKKIKETDLEIYVQTLKFKGIPAECDPANIRWYHSIANFFSKDKCLQYYETISKIAVEEVSLFKCVIDMYSFYLVRTPVKIYGMTIRDLTNELSASWPWPLNYILNIPVVLLFAVLGGIFILIIYGIHFKFSFFGTAIEIGDGKTVPETKMIHNSNSEKPKQIRVIRKLKPWTKSRFPKRLELDFGRRRKLFIKSSKSVTEIPESSQTWISNSYESTPFFIDSNESVTGSEIREN